MEIIERESSLEGYLLRPLSAKLLKPTIPEIKGWVNREKLFDIFGRSRKRQIFLAKKFKIKWYPQPAGGCLLTDPEFSKRLQDLMESYQAFDENDVELLKIGRHFWEDKIKIVVGRDHEENLKIKNLKKKGDILIEIENYPGPTALVRNYGKDKIEKAIEKAKNLTKKYSKKAKEDAKFKIEKV